MDTSNNSKGIILVLIAMATFSVHDAIIKFIFTEAALYEIYFGRTFIAALLSAAYLLLTKQKIILKTSYPILSIVRVVLHFLAFSFYFISLTYMSLAVATALYFSTPLFMSILAKLFLKEDIGIRRWLAISVGFIGIFVILNPDLSDFDFKNLLPVICALFYASSMTISKKTADKDNVHTQLFYFYILTVSICLVVFFLSGSGQFNKFDNPTMQFIFRDWFSNPTFTWKYIIVMGILASVAFTCIFKAYTSFSTSITSIFEYSLIIWSVIIGYFLFNDIPTLRTLLGIILVVGAGIFIFIREEIRKQKITIETPIRR
jgi:drug/metabolite transporter (DMT)-like permease